MTRVVLIRPLAYIGHAWRKVPVIAASLAVVHTERVRQVMPGVEAHPRAVCAQGADKPTSIVTEPRRERLVRSHTAVLVLGAEIEGVGTSFLKVEGVSRLHSANHRIIPDRLAAGTFAIAGVISQGSVTVRQVSPEHLDAVSYKLMEMGAAVTEGDNWVTAGEGRPLEAVEVQAIAYPGFPTDLQAACAALLTQAGGVSLVHERVFENRLGYAQELRRMGADIHVSGQTARIKGPVRLRGSTVRALDIRCGASLVLAALAAEGVTVIEDAFHIDRGYEDIEQTLRQLGAAVSRN